jgi:hypothetical protein
MAKIWQEDDDSISIYNNQNQWLIGDFDDPDDAQEYIDKYLSDDEEEE